MLKRFAEQWFGVKNKHQAAHIRRRLAIAYGFLGWNCFGIMLYMILKKEMPAGDASERRMSLTKLVGTSENMHVYQFEGLTLTKEFNVVYKAKVAQEEREAAKEKESAMINS